jgi:hypothetical protein
LEKVLRSQSGLIESKQYRESEIVIEKENKICSDPIAQIGRRQTYVESLPIASSSVFVGRPKFLDRGDARRRSPQTIAASQTKTDPIGIAGIKKKKKKAAITPRDRTHLTTLSVRAWFSIAGRPT